MADMFRQTTAFNQPINNWNVSSVTNMSGMFRQAVAFNQPISGWLTSSVTNMTEMFSLTNSFDQPIGGWDISSVTSMDGMFKGAVAFNQPLNNWVTSSVTNMTSLFESSPFNQDIGNWNVSSVTNMNGMFYHASAFNQDLSTWDLSAINSMSWMFENCGMDCINYSLMLNGWEANTNTPNGISLGAIGMVYDSTALAARTALTSTQGWTINGDTYDAGCSTALPVTLHSFNAIYRAPNAVLNWQSGIESDLSYYSIEKSMDGTNYHSVGKILVTGSGSYYSMVLPQPEGRAFYRLKMVDLDGKIDYSRIQVVSHQDAMASIISVFPNPVRDGKLHIKATKSGIVRIFNQVGQQVLRANVSEGLQVIDISLLARGIYLIKQEAETLRSIVVE
jgi:surface protein